MSSVPSSAELAAAAGVLQAALDAGIDPAIHFGGWTRLQRRALVMAVGASEAAYADAKAAATPPVKKAPARPPVDVAPAKAVSPAPSTVTQPASEPMSHLDAATGGQSAVFGKSPPPATWREVGFQSREHAEAAAAMNYVSALAFYAAMGRGELQVGPEPRPPPPRQPAQAASSSGDQAGPLAGYLAEADAKAAEDRRMRELQERIAGELRQDEADREAASGSGSRPAQPRARFPQPATTPAPVQARYPHANRETGEGFPALPRKPARNASAAVAAAADREYRTLVEERRQLCSAEWRAHIRAMEAPGAQSTEPIVNGDLQQLAGLAVANLAQLGDIEHQAATGEGQMMPLAGEAAYFFVRSLPPGVRGMRVPERLNGEVWVVGWCGRPCPAGRDCLSTVERCLRPIVVRRGAGAQLGDLAAHEHHECSECHRAGRRGRDY
ncbi:unnamed protein product [Symbiodinium necroappetens]|uniref:Uncharacterized protein n=1 Tax=Symbiodinium necroappetens TaxID=1628268 RepID=A0A812J2L6_9DINO|nr:unnamed protein product [Symbiodinium necroappetens]